MFLEADRIVKPSTFISSRRYRHGGMAKIKEKYITICLFVEPISAVTICFAYSVNVKPNWSPSPPHMDDLTSKWRYFAVLSPSLLLHYLHIFGKLGKFCHPPLPPPSL
jgi:hypothetical protein